VQYIDKHDGPNCLADIPADLPWIEFVGDCRDELINSLCQEQNRLCVYCERELEKHHPYGSIEHIRPQGNTTSSEGNFFPELRYCYENLTLSCFGYPPPTGNHDKIDVNDKSCNLHKGSEFSAELFLDPTKMENISNYFSWNRQTGEILASDSEIQKAHYMIKLLNLNAKHLLEARINARTAILKILKRDSDKFTAIKNRIRSGRYQFCSFLASHQNL